MVNRSIIIMSSCHICFLCLMILIITSSIFGMQSGPSNKFPHQYGSNNNQSTVSETTESEHLHLSHSKLLTHGACTNRDISISQSQDSSPGIPQFIVQIVNTCVSGCAPSKIHLHCGWFASERVVNPMTFKRLSYDDCLVNGGRPLKTSQSIRFTYSNSFMYNLAFKSAKFC